MFGSLCFAVIVELIDRSVDIPHESSAGRIVNIFSYRAE